MREVSDNGFSFDRALKSAGAGAPEIAIEVFSLDRASRSSGKHVRGFAKVVISMLDEDRLSIRWSVGV